MHAGVVQKECLGWSYKCGVANIEMLSEATAMDQDIRKDDKQCESRKEGPIQNPTK